MPRRLPLSLLPALILACSRSEATPRAASSAAESASPAATVSTANGSLAAGSGSSLGAGGAPRDSISERADRGRILGDANAPVWLIMASDFQCPYCKMWHDGKFAQIKQEYVDKGRVRMAFLNFPLGQHQNALPAAEAAMCGAVQNKFWAMHESLFATQPKWETMPNPQPLFDSLAVAAAMDMAPYHKCVSQHLTRALIDVDRDRGRESGVNSTPTFFVGDQVLGSADADVRGAIEAALAKAGSKKP